MAEPAVARTPRDVWYLILDECIRLDVFLATTCTHDSFGTFRELEKANMANWSRAEAQRNVLACVYKSWRVYAQARAFRWVELSPATRQMTTAKLIAPRARRVLLDGCDHKYLVESVWGIVDLYLDSPKSTGDLHLLASHAHLFPRLSRLNLFLLQPMHSSYQLILLDLQRFSKLTFLTITDQLSGPSPHWSTYGKLFLPRLEVFRWKIRESSVSSFSAFDFPVLKHLFLEGVEAGIIQDPAICTLSHLISLDIFTRPGGRIILPLPEWDAFPQLREFSIDYPFNAHRLPPTNHPLRHISILAPVASVEALRSLLAHLKDRSIVVQLNGVRWKIEDTRTSRLLQRQTFTNPRPLLSESRPSHVWAEIAASYAGSKLRIQDMQGRTLDEARLFLVMVVRVLLCRGA
jgi:hypothetical protein